MGAPVVPRLRLIREMDDPGIVAHLLQRLPRKGKELLVLVVELLPEDLRLLVPARIERVDARAEDRVDRLLVLRA